MGITIKGIIIGRKINSSYSGNRLIRVVDAADPVVTNGSMDFKDGADTGGEYTYNASGALTSDLNKGISGIDYDINGNMSKVTFSNGNTTEYVYSQSGAKQRVIHGTVTALPFAEPGISTAEAASVSRDTTEYIGDFVFRNGVLDRLLFRGGYMDIAGGVPRYHYFATDHLGSVRLVVSADGQVIERNDYYPSGCLITENIDGETVILPYKYNGKELDPMHGLYTYDYGARQYDPATILWDRMDPLCEDNPEVSPYAYCGDNPVNAIDPDGKKKVNWLGKSETGLLEKDFNDFADEFNVINIWAHGNNNGFRPRITGGRNLNKVIKTAEDFKKVIDYAKLFDKINPKNSIIVLHSCKTAEFAKKISNEGFFKENNITIIAPTENIVVTKSPQNSNSSFFTNLFDKFFGNDKPDFNYTTEVKTIIKNGEKKGKWNAYNKGRLVITYDSKEKPGSKGFNYKFINNGKR